MMSEDREETPRPRQRSTPKYEYTIVPSNDQARLPEKHLAELGAIEMMPEGLEKKLIDAANYTRFQASAIGRVLSHPAIGVQGITPDSIRDTASQLNAAVTETVIAAVADSYVTEVKNKLQECESYSQTSDEYRRCIASGYEILANAYEHVRYLTKMPVLITLGVEHMLAINIPMPLSRMARLLTSGHDVFVGQVHAPQEPQQSQVITVQQPQQQRQ